MIGHRHVLNAQKTGEVIQNLNGLLLDNDSTPYGMSDSLLGNDVIYSKSIVVQGSIKSILGLNSDDLYTLNSFKVTANCQVVDSETANILFGYRDSTTELLQITFQGGELKIQLRDSNNILQGSAIYSDLLIDYNLFDWIRVSCELINIQTATPTIKLYVDGIEVASQTYTKGSFLRSSSTVLFGTFGGATYTGRCNGITIYENDVITSQFPTCANLANLYDIINKEIYTLTTSFFIDTAFSHYGQRGFLTSGGGYIPISKDGIDFVDGTPLTDINAVLQDGFSLLNNQTQVKQVSTNQVLIDADVYNLWYDITGVPKGVTFAEIENAIASYPNVYGGDVISGKSIKNITLKK